MYFQRICIFVRTRQQFWELEKCKKEKNNVSSWENKVHRKVNFSKDDNDTYDNSEYLNYSPLFSNSVTYIEF